MGWCSGHVPAAPSVVLTSAATILAYSVHHQTQDVIISLGATRFVEFQLCFYGDAFLRKRRLKDERDDCKDIIFFDRRRTMMKSCRASLRGPRGMRHLGQLSVLTLFSRSSMQTLHQPRPQIGIIVMSQTCPSSHR